MKYIIEIEEMPFTSEGSEMQLFKATEFNSLVFDKTGLEKLTPYDESAAEQRVTEKAWELCKKILSMPLDDFIECFDDSEDASYAEARDKYEAWMKQKDEEIKVGDEVSYADNVFVVTRISGPEIISGIGKNGETFSMKDKKKWHKTGRHFPEIADLLEKMRKPGC